MTDTLLPIGDKLIWVDKTTSTNDYLNGLLKKERLVHGSVVAAIEQTAGKGLGTNRWESEPGQNLTCSFYLEHSFLLAKDQFKLNMSVSLALFDFVGSLTGPTHQVRIKWPNDIYIDRGKLAGILLYHAIEGEHILYSIAGVGVNLNQQTFSSAIPNPVSLVHFVKAKLDLAGCLKSLCGFMDNRYAMLRNSDDQSLRKNYMDALFGNGEWRDYQYEGKPVYGKISTK